MYPERPPWRGEEGPKHRLTIGPGVLTLARKDLAKAERTASREAGHHPRSIDQAAITINDGGAVHTRHRSRIYSWSARSRSRMVQRLAELDWAPVTGTGRIPAMLTLTYPGRWQEVVPDSAAMDGHLRAFYRRWERAWGEPLACAWKKEYQRRGAPHWCAYAVPPHGDAGEHRISLLASKLKTSLASDVSFSRERSYRPAVGDGLPFHRWLSAVWTDIVNPPDPEERRKHLLAGTGVDFADGMRSSDPKRIAVYFTKHGQFRAKEYQNHPPPEWQEAGGCGRFWGYRGLHRAVVTVELGPGDYLTAARTLRRWARAQHVTRQVAAPRARNGRMHPAAREVIGLAGAQLLDAHRVKRRTVRRRARYLHRGGGFVCVNDGPAMAAALARYLSARSLAATPGPWR
jgi:hypothetical protein